MISRRVLVTGRVQGVFYRDSCRQEAERRGVAGWVRNLADGSVEAVFRGEADDVEALIKWAHRGPAQAQVDAVQVTVVEASALNASPLKASGEPVDDATGFRIR